jgi:hypothetical protein
MGLSALPLDDEYEYSGQYVMSWICSLGTDLRLLVLRRTGGRLGIPLRRTTLSIVLCKYEVC